MPLETGYLREGYIIFGNCKQQVPATHSLACSEAAEVSCCKLQLWGRSCVGWVNIDAWVAWLTVVPAVDWVNQATQSSLFLLQLSGCAMNFDATQAPFVELVKALVEQVQSEH